MNTNLRKNSKAVGAGVGATTGLAIYEPISEIVAKALEALNESTGYDLTAFEDPISMIVVIGLSGFGAWIAPRNQYPTE